jgi:glycosyltransferase involved in cell wall biosynthesis
MLNRCLITNCLGGLGGGEIAILRHLDHSSLPPERLAVAVLNDGPFVQAIQARGIRCQVVGRAGRDGSFPGRGESLQIAWRLYRLIRRLGVSHVLCYSIPDLRATLVARLGTRFQLAWRSQGEWTVELPDGGRDPMLVRLLAGQGRRIDRIVPTTRRDAEMLVAHGAPRRRVRTVYLGVEDQWFGPHPSEPEPRQRVVLSGRLVPWKGQRTFLSAFARVAADFPQAEAWIVGGGDPAYADELAQQAEQLGIGPRVRFWGHRTDAVDLVRRCDIAVHCSQREPFGLVLIEAMACGVPVVAADVQGPREILRHGETGFLIDPANPAAYAATLSALLSDAALRQRIGSAGREAASQRFRVRTNTHELEDVLFTPSCAEQGARPFGMRSNS